MGALVGLGVGVGLLLMWSAFVVPRDARAGAAKVGRLEAMLAAAGMRRVSVNSLLALCVAVAAVTLAVIQVVSRTLPVSLVFAVMAGYLPVAVVAGRARQRQRELAAIWPEAVDNLASAVRAGLSLPEALAGLAERGPEPLRPGFAEFARDYQVSGRFTDSLDRLKENLADPVGDRVVEGLRVAREVGGGDLGRLLRNLSGYLRDDERTRAELESRQAWTVNGARLAVAAPWLVLLLLCFQPEVVTRYSSTAGVVVLVAGAVACLAAYRLMMRIGRLPTDQRILS